MCHVQHSTLPNQYISTMRPVILKQFLTPDLVIHSDSNGAKRKKILKIYLLSQQYRSCSNTGLLVYICMVRWLSLTAVTYFKKEITNIFWESHCMILLRLNSECNICYYKKWEIKQWMDLNMGMCIFQMRYGESRETRWKCRVSLCSVRNCFIVFVIVTILLSLPSPPPSTSCLLLSSFDCLHYHCSFHLRLQ